MGLDMFLEREHYVKSGEWSKPEHVCVVTVTKGGKPHPDIQPERVKAIIEDIAYWRKFNALHNWFVRNVQDDRDEGQRSYVSHSHFVELLDVLTQVSADHSLAEKLLPTQDGFFFGSTEYDEFYWDDLETTIPVIQKIVEGRGEGYYYRASW